MSTKLTRKQVNAFSRSLRRKGRKLPKDGWCAIIKNSSGTKIAEVCTGRDPITKNKYYYRVGSMDEYKKTERYTEKFPDKSPKIFYMRYARHRVR